jgi:hypothetical protein
MAAAGRDKVLFEEGTETKGKGMKRELTPSQELWAAVFGGAGEQVPALDREKVLAIVDSLSDSHERIAVRMRFGFDEAPLTMEQIGQRLPRADGSLGVSRQRARMILAKALRHLRHPKRRPAWEKARVRK